MPNVAEIKNICVYLQANNYTIQLYLYTDRKMTKERKQEREKKRGGGKVTKMLIYLTNVKSKTVPKVVENCLLYVVTNTRYPLKHLLTKMLVTSSKFFSLIFSFLFLIFCFVILFYQLFNISI